MNIEVSYIFSKVPTSLLFFVQVRFFYVIYIIVGLSHVYMVIIHLFNGLGWSFPAIANREIIFCEALLHRFT